MQILVNALIDFLLDKAKNIFPTSTTIVVLILILLIAFLDKGKLIKVEFSYFKKFKKIREEYKRDKVNGCFLLQEYFDRYLPTDEIEYIINILNSPNAFKIFPLLKVGRKKCEFKENKYISKVTRCNYIVPFFIYIVFLLILTFQNMYIDNKILTEIGLRGFIVILIFDLFIIVPVMVICLLCIDKITRALKLAKKTNEEKEEVPKTTNFISHFKKYGRKRRGTKVLVTVFSR
ncbi:MAG: hypothetical protein LBQ82_06505 [Treponema sp.]|nr:hypothetical protein [Treponema sp.]